MTLRYCVRKKTHRNVEWMETAHAPVGRIHVRARPFHSFDAPGSRLEQECVARRNEPSSLPFAFRRDRNCYANCYSTAREAHAGTRRETRFDRRVHHNVHCYPAHDGPPTDHMSRCRDYAVNIAIAGTSPLPAVEGCNKRASSFERGDRSRGVCTGVQIALLRVAARDRYLEVLRKKKKIFYIAKYIGAKMKIENYRIYD